MRRCILSGLLLALLSASPAFLAGPTALHGQEAGIHLGEAPAITGTEAAEAPPMLGTDRVPDATATETNATATGATATATELRFVAPEPISFGDEESLAVERSTVDDVAVARLSTTSIVVIAAVVVVTAYTAFALHGLWKAVPGN